MDNLPPETLQRIASFSSCESVLALIQVSRHFYKTIYDRAVFRSVILNRNGCGGKRWDCAFIRDITSTADLARLALADFRARTWLNDERERVERAVSDH
jgi:F-box-like